jgi:hypothetical protein
LGAWGLRLHTALLVVDDDTASTPPRALSAPRKTHARSYVGYSDLHQQVAIDNYVPNRGARGAKGDNIVRIDPSGSQQLRPVDLEHQKIGRFALLDAADLRLEADSPSPLAGGQPQRVETAKRLGPVPTLLQQTRQTQLFEEIEVVVAGSAVGTEADRNPGTADAHHIGNTRTQLQVGAWTVDNAEVVSLHPRQMTLVEPDPMRDPQTCRQDAAVFEVGDLVAAAL